MFAYQPMMPAPGNLPRLPYVGDVPAESTPGGSASLFRLPLDYPKQSLRIVQSRLHPQTPR
jgi:hypothetical protein